MQILVSETAPPGWDDYVGSHPAASAYHRSAAVQIGRTAFGLRCWFLLAQDEGHVRGVLPLVLQSSRLFGRFLVSVPFFTYGGALADSVEALQALVERAIGLARELRVDHLELRHTAGHPVLGLQQRLDKVSLVLPLPSSPQALAQSLGSKLRSQIRRADREQPEVQWGGPELVPEFHAVFTDCMHRLGTPAAARPFFEATFEALGSLLDLLVVRVRGKAMAAAILLRHGEVTEVPWAATLAESRPISLNMRMYWELLSRSIESGAREFDFGRSTVDSGTYRFKRQWGAQPRQLHWHYWMASGGELPRLNASNPRYALASAIWRRLPRLCVDQLGPRLIRHLP